MKLFLHSKKFWFWLLLIFLIFIFHFIGLLRPLESVLLRATSPINKYFHRLSTNIYDRGSDFDSLDEANGELARLKGQLARATVNEAQMELLVEENAKLRQQLDFVSNNDYRTLSANIVSRQNLFNGTDRVQDIILDKGLADGVIPGLGVVDEQGIIIGKIVESKDYSARACLTVAPACNLAVGILNSDRTLGLSDGDLGLTIKLDYVPQLENINQGDIVITSGLGDNIPRGLVVGRVTQVNKQSNEIWQDVSIESLASIYNLTVVSVIIP